jgi:hypothetical protein
MTGDQPIQIRRLVLALGAGAVACAASLAIVGLIRGGTAIGIVGLLVFVMYVFAGLLMAVLFGLPALFILRALGAVNLWTVLLTGAVIGAAVGWCSADGDDRAGSVGPWLVAGIAFAQISWSAWRWAGRGQAA